MEATTIKAIVAIIAFAVVNTAAFWIREWLKHRTWNKNGKALKEIKADIKSTHDKVDCVDKKVGETKVEVAEINVAVKEQKTQCATTVRRFDEAIRDQGHQIVDLAGKKG